MDTTAELHKAPPRADIIQCDTQLHTNIDELVASSWRKIAPTWPLEGLIAVNPLAGFEDLVFEDALRAGQVYFQQKTLPTPMQEINRQTIKWLQVFFDYGQATLPMPLRANGLFGSIIALLPYDSQVRLDRQKTMRFLDNLTIDPNDAIEECLLHLRIGVEHQLEFLILMLTTLPGWAAHIKYRTEWSNEVEQMCSRPVTQSEYLALRLVLTCLIWPQAKEIMIWHQAALKHGNVDAALNQIEQEEHRYRSGLLNDISHTLKTRQEAPDVQLIFCIDVRSEPFRRRIENQGNYETFGFAGFFGVPVSIQNSITGQRHASCPALLKPMHHIIEHPTIDSDLHKQSHNQRIQLKQLYQSLKYTFTTPFTLVEALGPISGLWMGFRSFLPQVSGAIHQIFKRDFDTTLDVNSISLKQQVRYALNAMRMIGLTKNFSPLIVICGHGSETQNNAYATALDCGACGGNSGAPNAKILTDLLNKEVVRSAMASQGVRIPESTQFIAAEHNTTTDEVIVYDTVLSQSYLEPIKKLKSDLIVAREKNSRWRAEKMGHYIKETHGTRHTKFRAQDWAQVRPEWGLARNAAFIIGPRALTQHVDLEGRCFLHSYEYKEDSDSSALTAILTAPMVVAQWINAQYFFSSYDNVAFGSGSKVSKNITGKIGIMQGNASDLMHGLPLQSVNKSDGTLYHQPLRLMTVVYAPQQMIDRVIAKEAILQTLFKNGWVTLACIDPDSGQPAILSRALQWERKP